MFHIATPSRATKQCRTRHGPAAHRGQFAPPGFAAHGVRVSGAGLECAHRIVWDPTATAYTNAGVLSKFSVAPTPVHLYMIVDLTKSAGADGQIAYVYEADLTNGVWGSWVSNPVTNGESVVASVVWTGVTNDSSYVTDKLVLRRVPAGSFGMGDSTNISVRLTKACYAGVFAVTEAQWAKVMGGSGTSKPKTSVSYDDVRGATNSALSVNWPVTDRKIVTPGSFLGRLRAATGISDFDLPTEAQWEYLCRAGTTTAFNDGNAAAKYSGTVENNNGNTNKYLHALGWYKFNCSAVQPVGQKAANAWGLYDAHGGVWEFCLDWHGVPLAGGDDPQGATSGSAREIRGGGWNNAASYCHSAYRFSYGPSTSGTSVGFRLVRTLP